MSDTKTSMTSIMESFDDFLQEPDILADMELDSVADDMIYSFKRQIERVPYPESRKIRGLIEIYETIDKYSRWGCVEITFQVSWWPRDRSAEELVYTVMMSPDETLLPAIIEQLGPVTTTDTCLYIPRSEKAIKSFFDEFDNSFEAYVRREIAEVLAL